MSEPFLININCSAILDDDETYYSMFIDSTKMSIVYELVEWIRWLFSLDSCIYLTHGGSVIHELEDIKLLSALKNFEVRPCGKSQCVHKKTYRILLANLNLFVYWNDTLVHKYFLDKLNQVEQKLSGENNKSNPIKFTLSSNEGLTDSKEKKNYSTKSSSSSNKEVSYCENTTCSESVPLLQKKTVHNFVESKPIANEKSPNKKLMKNFQINSDQKSNSFSDSNENLNIMATNKNTEMGIKKDKPEKNSLGISPEFNKNKCKTFSKNNYVKPFSLGSLLSNMREDLEKQNMQVQKNSSNNFPLMEEENFEDKTSAQMGPDDEFYEVKRRKRIRKRKSKKQNIQSEEYISTFLSKNNSDSGLDFFKSNTKSKPNHIRFEIENDDNIMETDSYEDELKSQPDTEFENSRKINSSENNSGEFIKTEPKTFKLFPNDSQPLLEQSQIVSIERNTETKMEESSIDHSVTKEDKLIDLDYQCNNTEQPHTPVENFQENKFNSDLLLCLKEKCKNPVVFERFY